MEQIQGISTLLHIVVYSSCHRGTLYSDGIVFLPETLFSIKMLLRQSLKPLKFNFDGNIKTKFLHLVKKMLFKVRRGKKA